MTIRALASKLSTCLLVTHAGSCFAAVPVLQFVSADYRAFASAQASTDFDEQDFRATSGMPIFSVSAQASASFEDPDLGPNSAYAAASVFWSVTYSGRNATLHAGAGGIAEAVSTGLDTYSTGFGTLSVYFDVSASTSGVIDSEGTYPTDLYRFDGNDFVPFYTGMSGPDRIDLLPGTYRWDGSGGESVSGYSYYSSGVDFFLTTMAVPEPTGLPMLMTGLSVLALLRRRTEV